MISIDESYVDSQAPNAEAIKNGRGLVLKGKYLKLHKSEDETLLFGECAGSGSKPYFCSCDFANPASPTHRCSCPSRQFPCKHCLGLMYAFTQGKKFTVATVPDDLAQKREKLAERKEKKKEAETKPREVNKDALAKKVKAQLEGLNLLETLTNDLVRLGMGNLNAKAAGQMEEQAKQLGNAYLPGAQAALYDYTRYFTGDDGKFDTDMSSRQREAVYSDGFDQLTRLQSLVKQGRAYLTRRLEDPDLKPETETGIAAWLGHAWQLRELKDAGLVQADVQLIQLAFNSHDDVARREYVDTGIWMNLNTGKIQLTQNFRPYHAVKFIKSDDSFFQVAQIKELCVYPGDVNRRVRWEEMLPRPVEAGDFERIRRHAHTDFQTVIKEVKNTLKAPLGDRHPVYALNFTRIGRVGNDLVAEDGKGGRLCFTDKGMSEEPRSCHLLPLLPESLLKGNTIIARFRHDLDSRRLQIKPLSIVTKDGIVRLTF